MNTMLKIETEATNEEYRIVHAVGKGRFSTVYRAVRKSDKTTFALKKIQLSRALKSKVVEKTLREVKIMQTLQHPNIIKYFHSFVEKGNILVIVLEWAGAGDLRRQLKKLNEHKPNPLRLPERIVWKSFYQISAAIRHMHDKRVLHRDLKPANIFLMRNGCIKVGDLGLGRLLGDRSQAAYSKVGTPLYMSPEALRGLPYDYKSDIWSLGCILYELVMLRSPFKEDGLTMVETFKKIMTGTYRPIQGSVSPSLHLLVRRMISLDPSQRPSIHEVCDISSKLLEELTLNSTKEVKKTEIDHKRKASRNSPSSNSDTRKIDTDSSKERVTTIDAKKAISRCDDFNGNKSFSEREKLLIQKAYEAGRKLQRNETVHHKMLDLPQDFARAKTKLEPLKLKTKH